MPRPQKHTVDYFSHDTNSTAGATVQILQARFGNDGYAAWFKLLELLGRTDGHAYKIGTPMRREFLSAHLGVQPDKCQQILECLAHLEAIDPQLFKHDIIWSQGFINRLEELYKRRKCNCPQKPSISEQEPSQAQLPSTETIINDDSCPQIKLNKIKTKTIAKCNKKIQEKISDPLFDEFWSAYPQRRSENGTPLPKGSKVKAVEYFGKLGEADKVAVISAAQRYAASGTKPVDAERFFRSRDKGDNYWQAWVGQDTAETPNSGHPAQPGGLKPATSAEEIRARHSQRPVEVTEKGEL